MKYFLFTLIFCLLLSGCGEKPMETAHFSVQREDTRITLNAPAEPVLEALGAPFGYGEYRSGAYAGVEKTYRFPGLNLRTYSSQDGERILGVMITDSSLQTPEGISIGDSASRVRECFGSDAIQSGCCTVSRGGEQMVVLLEHNVVTAIQYSLI